MAQIANFHDSNDLEDCIEKYKSKLEDLATSLKPKTNEGTKKSLRDLKTQLSDRQKNIQDSTQTVSTNLQAAVMERDHLEDCLRRLQIRLKDGATHEDLDRLTKCITDIIENDKRLYEISRKALHKHWINVPAWREVNGTTDEVRWWWYLDTEAQKHNTYVSFPPLRFFTSILFGYILPILLLYLSLGLIMQTAERFANFVLRFLGTVDTSALGFDLLTIGTIIFQFVLNGRISSRFANSLTTTLNRQLRRANGLTRTILIHVFPVSQFLIGTLIFLGITVLLYYVFIPRLATTFRSGAQLASCSQGAGRSLAKLEISALLDPDPTYAIDLTRIGLCFEEAGDLQQAQQIYEQALNADPALIFTRYRLAELSIDAGQPNSALRLLDEGIRQLEDYQDEKISLPLDGLNQARQMYFLMLVSRGKALLSRAGNTIQQRDTAAREALIDLRQAQVLSEHKPEYQDLLIRVNNIDDPPDKAIRTSEMYYYLAIAYDERIRFVDEPQLQADLREKSEIAWDAVKRLADQSDSQERTWLIEANQRDN